FVSLRPGVWMWHPGLKPVRGKKTRRKSVPLSGRYVKSGRTNSDGNSDHDKKGENFGEEFAGSLRRLRWTLCSRNAHGRIGGTGAALRESKTRPQLPAPPG